MKKAIIFFLIVCTILLSATSCGADKDKNNSVPSGSTNNYNVISAEQEAEYYYMAFRNEDKTLMKSVVEAYVFRSSEGKTKQMAEMFFDSSLVLLPEETNIEGDDASWDTVNSSGILRIAIINNGKFAYAEDIDGELNTTGYFDSIGRLISMHLKLTSDVKLFDTKDEAVSALKNGEVDCIIGIDNNNNEIAYSFPIVKDELVYYTANESIDKSNVTILTISQYLEAAKSLGKEAVVKNSIQECINELGNNKSADNSTCVLCKISDIPVIE